MSFAAVIDYFRTGPAGTPAAYTVTRRGTNTLDDAGIVVLASPTTFTITAVVQPHAGRKLDALPSGQRGEDVKLLHTTTQLRTADADGAADVVTISTPGGTAEAWIVSDCQGPWTHPAGGTFYRARLTRAPSP